MVLKTGTKTRPPTPTQNTTLRWKSLSSCSGVCTASATFSPSSRFPFSPICRMSAGMTIEMMEGIRISLMTPAAVIRPLFHSMMVVTSPIGEKAPPLLAAMMTSAA